MSARLLLFGCWLAGLLAAGPVRAQLPGAQQALDSVRRKYRLPALLAAVIEPGSIHYVYGGVRRRGEAEPVALTDYFHIGSNTKAVTSLLAARLVEKGKIRWDSKLTDVVPGLRGHVSAAFAGVTLEQLLSHRAGLPPYTSEQEYTHLPALVGTVSEKRLRFAQVILREQPVASAPGQAYVYSNADYVLAALMLEQATQQSWEELVEQAFHKLRLRYVLGFPNRSLAQQPWGHWRRVPADTVLTPLGPDHPYQLRDYMAPAGDLAMPLPDVARLVQLHLNGLLGHRNYLKANTYQLLHFGKPEYAYGWAVTTQAVTGAPVSLHEGSAGTFFCHTILFPSQKIAFVVLTNAGGDDAQKACNELRRRLKKLYRAPQPLEAKAP